MSEQIINDGANIEQEVKPIKNENVASENKFTQADIDRAVTQALKTRESKIRQEEEKKREELKSFFEKEAMKNQELSAEERVKKMMEEHQSQMDEREKKANIREAEVELKNAGFSKEEIEFYVSDITADRDISMARITKICDLQKARQDKLTKEFNEKMASQVGNNLQTGSSNSNDLQNQYDEAKKNKNTPLMSAIQRKAHSNNIKLKLY